MDALLFLSCVDEDNSNDGGVTSNNDKDIEGEELKQAILHRLESLASEPNE